MWDFKGYLVLLRLTEMKPSQALRSPEHWPYQWVDWGGPEVPYLKKKPGLTGEDTGKMINTKWGLRAWETLLCIAALEEKGSGVSLRYPADCHPNTFSPQPREECIRSSERGSRFPRGSSPPSPLRAPFKMEPGSGSQGWADTAISISFVWAPLRTQGCCTWQVFPVSSLRWGAAFSLSQHLWKLFVEGLQCPFIFHMPASLILYLTSHLGIAHSAVHV